MNKILIALLMIPVLYAGEVKAQDCGALASELHAMKNAQQQIMKSLADNHETFAVSVEEVTAELELRSSKVPAKAIKSMNKTAQAFRQRGVQAKKTVEALGEATEDLIARVETCLQKSGSN